MVEDDLWTLPTIGGLLLFVAGVLAGAIATDRIQGAKLDAYLDGRQAEAVASDLSVCRERGAYLERFRPDVTQSLSEVGR